MVLGVLRGLDDVDVCTNNPHAYRTSDTSDEQKLSSSKLIDEEKQPHESHNGLDDTENTGHHIDSIGLDTDTL